MEKKGERLVTQNAGFIIRFLAYLTDQLLICLPGLIIGIFIMIISPSREELFVNLGILFIFSLLLYYIIFIVYQVLCTHYLGGSLGKIAFGLSVVNEEGRHLSLVDALFRFVVGYAVSNLVLGLGFLWIIRDRQRKAWHDMLTGTEVVIKEKNYALGILTLLSLLIILLIFTFILIFRLYSF